jgi:putative ABC transport system permease protein
VPPEPDSLRRVVDEDARNLYLGLAGLALVVGMVGIANSSLVSVLERTSEIGLRRAIGARRHHIFIQFVVETGLLAATGGMVGTFVGLTTTLAVSVFYGWRPTLPTEILILAPVIGTISGIVAGVQPAARAARTSPVRALRS